MLNKIWPTMIIISVIFGLLNGRIKEVNEAIFVSLEDTIEMGISFLRNNVLLEWNDKNTKKHENIGKN